MAPPYFVHFPHLKWVHCYSPKCGSKTWQYLYRYFYGKHWQPDAGYTLEAIDALAADNWVTKFIRDPLKRLTSGYRYFKYRHDVYLRTGKVFAASKHMWRWLYSRPSHKPLEFDEFVRASLTVMAKDKHIAPQYGCHGFRAQWLWPFERFTQGWQIMRDRMPALPEAPPHMNASEKQIEAPWTPELLELAREFYAQDIKWHTDVSRNAAEIWAARSTAGNP